MANFKAKTRYNEESNQSTRAYFCCHPDDFETHFEKVCDDILKIHDCQIYYTEDMTEHISDEERTLDLSRSHFFVVPVTEKLLKTPNRAMDEDIKFAFANNIPVLPLMMERGIEDIYSASDKFGDIHYLSPNSNDETELKYENKLKAYLDSVILNDEMIERVKKSFYAYIFLSYRKKDRKHANELMRFVHNIPEFRDVAIWFDEYLNPSESFKSNIEKMLKNSMLFTLLVTPSLLEYHPDGTPNFVMKEEYPKANEMGIDILPIEMETTNRVELEEKYKGLPASVNLSDRAGFIERFAETAKKYAFEPNDTPEHNFLIGLAYLYGIDIEINSTRALELITSAAEMGLIEAQKKLIDIYKNGIGVDRDLKKACKYKAIVNERLKNGLIADFDVILKRSEITAGDETEAFEVNYEQKRALDFFKAKVGGKVADYCEEQKELSDIWLQAGDSEMAATVLGETIDFLESNTSYDIQEIYENYIIGKPNSDMLNMGYFSLHIKLIRLIAAERKNVLLYEWHKKIKRWTEELKKKYINNEDILHFSRLIDLELARGLYIDGKFADLKALLMEFNDKLIERIRNGVNVNFDNSMFSIDADGNILFDDKGFTSLYTKMPRYYDFLCESFMLLGDAHVKLGEYTEAVEAYSEAVSANNYSEEYKSDDRDLALKLKLAEANAKNSAIDEAKSILSKVEIRLRFLSEASMNELSLMREQKRIEGYIARQIGEGSAETSFNEAIKLAHIMLKESPTTENRKYIVELYENLFATTNSEEVKKDCVEKMIGFANSNLMKQSAPKTMEALGDIFMSIYRCNKDEQYLKKSNQIFKKLVERYPESSVFLAKLYIVKAYLSE